MAKRVKRKVRKNVVRAIVHIRATFNNTLITITDLDGKSVSKALVKVRLLPLKGRRNAVRILLCVMAYERLKSGLKGLVLVVNPPSQHCSRQDCV